MQHHHKNRAVMIALLAALAPMALAETMDTQLTEAERNALGTTIASCWNPVIPDGADPVRVEVAFTLDRDGRVEGDIVLLNHDAAPAEVANASFAAARRAILRCQISGDRDGYALPAEKYDQWREVRIDFAPDALEIR